ncbi:MAG: monovalent cation/H+ antiporter complex subunit F [Planctomycetes bacterium]|jgi:multicomponent Na+:H+ antiporter subunit F|nr:monovalent cation/H+ antiporter complex subunit F [Planctomycetota bacterium]
MTFLHVLMASLVVSMFLCLYRVMAGPTPADRTVSVDILGVLMVGFCAVLTAMTGRDVYMIVGVSWSLLSFVATLALAKHLEGRSFDD